MRTDLNNVSVEARWENGEHKYYKVVAPVKTMSGCRFGYEKEISEKKYVELYNLLNPKEAGVILPSISKTQAGQYYI